MNPRARAATRIGLLLVLIGLLGQLVLAVHLGSVALIVITCCGFATLALLAAVVWRAP